MQFLQKEAQILAFVALHFCAKNSTLRNQNCTILFLRYSILRNFVEQILIKSLILGANCVNYFSIRLHVF